MTEVSLVKMVAIGSDCISFRTLKVRVRCWVLTSGNRKPLKGCREERSSQTCPLEESP